LRQILAHCVWCLSLWTRKIKQVEERKTREWVWPTY
jgi:hypothetical protein